MVLDPQILAGIIAAALFGAASKLYQIGTRQGRTLRKANRRIEHLESYVLDLRRCLRVGGERIPPFPAALAYLDPADDDEGDPDND